MVYEVTLARFKGVLKHIILYAVATLGNTYGYELRRYIAKMFNLHYIPSNGILYPTLHELEKEGLLASYISGRRRVYILTKKGLEYFVANKIEIENTIRKVDQFFKTMSQLDIDKLIDIIQSLWEKNIDLPQDVIDKLRVKIIEIIDILNRFVIEYKTESKLFKS